jgi:hypothetical protein
MIPKKKYHPSYAFDRGYLSVGEKFLWSNPECFSRHSSYRCPKGIVLIDEYRFNRRKGFVDEQTEFSTVFKGRWHRMTVDVVELKRRSLMSYASRFINDVIEEM